MAFQGPVAAVDLPTQDFDRLQLHIERYVRGRAAHVPWATVGTKCVNYFEGEQWSAEDKAILEAEGRPVSKFNRISPLVRLLYGFFKQNRLMTRYLPGNDGIGTQDIADTLTAVSTITNEANGTKWTDAEVFLDGIITGRGFWDRRLDFDRNLLGEIKETVVDPFSVKIDPDAVTYDPKGWNFVCKDRWMSLEEIFLLYGQKAMDTIWPDGSAGLPLGRFQPDAGLEDMPAWAFGLYTSLNSGAFSNSYLAGTLSAFAHLDKGRRLIRVIEGQHNELVMKKCVVDLDVGALVPLPVDWDRNKIALVMQWAQTKGYHWTVTPRQLKQVRWMVSAGDILLYDDWSIYDSFTIIPYFPYFRRGKTMGMVEDLLDPQDEVNKRRSAMTHIVMTMANSGWVYERGSLEGEMEDALEQSGSTPGINIRYEKGHQPPTRIQPGAPPMAMERLQSMAEDDLKSISGVNDSALGQLDRVQSGKAIISRQRQALMATEMYFDNFSRSQHIKGERTRDMIQRHYTEQRIFRMRGEDGTDQQIVLNEMQADGAIANDVTLGQYNVVVDEAPAASNFEDAQFQEAQDIIQTLPWLAQLIPDILVETSHLPRKDEIKKRIQQRVQVGEVQQDAALMGAQAQKIQATEAVIVGQRQLQQLVAPPPPQPPMQPGAPAPAPNGGAAPPPTGGPPIPPAAAPEAPWAAGPQ